MNEKLFALKSTAAAIEFCSRQRFFLVNQNYALCIAAVKPENAVEVTPADRDRLRDSDRQWMTQSLSTMLMEELERKEAEIVPEIEEQINRLECLLKKAKGADDDGTEPGKRTE